MKVKAFIISIIVLAGEYMDQNMDSLNIILERKNGYYMFFYVIFSLDISCLFFPRSWRHGWRDSHVPTQALRHDGPQMELWHLWLLEWPAPMWVLKLSGKVFTKHTYLFKKKYPKQTGYHQFLVDIIPPLMRENINNRPMGHVDRRQISD